MKSVLYVRLPCWKIYPGGLVSLADYVHKHNPSIEQRIIELSLIPSHKRRAYLKEAIKHYQPDVIAFSWRNIQTFSPHDGTDALQTVLKFDYSSKLGDKLSSVYAASRMVLDFIYELHKNKSYIALAKKQRPDARIVVGGTAFSCFPEQLIRQLPEGVIGISGEGEAAMLKLLEGRSLEDESVVYVKDGQLTRHQSQSVIDLSEFSATDFSYIRKIFPEFDEFIGEEIGVQSKRGCPYSCTFCLYNIIEGRHVRHRRPAVVVEDITTLAKQYGVKKFWFTDSQFIAEKRSLPMVEEVLDRMIAARLDISWSGFLRVENIHYELAKKMIDSGISSFDLSFTGSQKIIDNLKLHYKLNKQMEAFRTIKQAGFADQFIKLYLPLNSPGETEETLLQTIQTCRQIYDIFGEDRVHPWLFFLAIQSGTALEKNLIEEGYLSSGYNPLSYNPFTIKKLLYNPPGLGRLIGQSFLTASRKTSESQDVGKLTLDIIEGELLSRHTQNNEKAITETIHVQP